MSWKQGMRLEEIEELARLPLFTGVDLVGTDAVLRESYLQRFTAQVEPLREGGLADILQVVVDHPVEVFSAYRDREIAVSAHGAGARFIVAAVVFDRVYSNSTRPDTRSNTVDPHGSSLPLLWRGGSVCLSISIRTWRCLSRRRGGIEELETAVAPRAAGQLVTCA